MRNAIVDCYFFFLKPDPLLFLRQYHYKINSSVHITKLMILYFISYDYLSIKDLYLCKKWEGLFYIIDDIWFFKMILGVYWSLIWSYDSLGMIIFEISELNAHEGATFMIFPHREILFSHAVDEFAHRDVTWFESFCFGTHVDTYCYQHYDDYHA
jgi:hypothetical protein